MDTPILQMSLHEYAELQTRFGVKVICQNGRFWRQVRPFFFRPLLPVEAYGETAVPPPVAWPSWYQYVVAAGQPSNSTMNFIMLDDLASYSLGSLTHKRRQLIKRAAQQFQVRRLSNSQELKEQGHKAYLSFYDRTRYPYHSARRNKAVFGRWIDNLFGSPKAILLGGYGPNGLAAISTSYWINETLVYSTLICESEALRLNLGELMFHEIRRLAAQQPRIKKIFVRSYQSGSSLDQYYLLRGCRLSKMPAWLEMPSSVQTMIHWIMPEKYKLLCGDD